MCVLFFFWTAQCPGTPERAKVHAYRFPFFRWQIPCSITPRLHIARLKRFPLLFRLPTALLYKLLPGTVSTLARRGQVRNNKPPDGIEPPQITNSSTKSRGKSPAKKLNKTKIALHSGCQDHFPVMPTIYNPATVRIR